VTLVSPYHWARDETDRFGRFQIDVYIDRDFPKRGKLAALVDSEVSTPLQFKQYWSPRFDGVAKP
jgi:hypothetical protein